MPFSAMEFYVRCTWLVNTGTDNASCERRQNSHTLKYITFSIGERSSALSRQSIMSQRMWGYNREKGMRVILLETIPIMLFINGNISD